jgi:hypothetical protein
LVVTEQEKFDIAECQPQIGALELAQILEDLNDTEDMSTLARRMSKFGLAGEFSVCSRSV